MKKITPFAILIIALLSVKCSNKKTISDNKGDINNKNITQILHFPDSGADTLKTSYFADTVIYIPLETTPESFIRNIYQLWVNDSVILVYHGGGDLLMFQLNGKFVRKIGKQGKGPGEYEQIFHFDVILDTIYISSRSKRSLLRYTFDDTFCDEIEFHDQPAIFNTTFDQKLAIYDDAQGKVFVYNKNFYTPDTIIVEYGVTKGRYYYSFGDPFFMTYFQKTPSGLLFNDYMNDTVWNITGDKKEPTFILDLKDKLPRNKHIEFCKGDFGGWENMAKSYQLVHLIPFSSCMFVFQKHWCDSKYDAIYLKNSKTGEIKKYNTSYIYDDIVGKQKLPGCFFIYSTDYLVTYYSEPYKVLKQLKQINEKFLEGTSPLWLNQMETVKEDGNPILALIKIKKDLQ
ncbi:MAG: 6-bladed beta-propeller [Bacteroidales bacterium]